MTTASPSSAELRRQYELRFAETRDYRQRVWRLLTKKFFQKYVPARGTVLDLGCGWGEFINHIEARTKYGMDLNPDGEVRLAPGVKFLEQDCSQTWPLADDSLDVVFTSNFFEHLYDKERLKRTVAEVYRCLKRGGRLIAMGPNIKYLPGAYWDFWDHYTPLTEASLSELFRLQGFAVEECIGRFLPYTMSTGFRPPLMFLRLYLRLRLAWRFFGKQFLVIGRK